MAASDTAACTEVCCEKKKYKAWGVRKKRERTASSDPGTVAQTSISCFIRREQLYKRNKRLDHCGVGRQEAAASMTLKPLRDPRQAAMHHVLQLLGSFSRNAELGTHLGLDSRITSPFS